MPATYTQEQREKIIERVLAGLSAGTPLAVLCREDGMASDNTIRDWAGADPELAVAIARARESGFDVLAAECLDIADETRRDTIRTEEGGDRPDTEWISRSKLRIETRLKLLAKWDPKRYGEATMIKHADANGEKLPVDDVTRAARLAALAAQINRQREQADDASD